MITSDIVTSTINMNDLAVLEDAGDLGIFFAEFTLGISFKDVCRGDDLAKYFGCLRPIAAPALGGIGMVLDF